MRSMWKGSISFGLVNIPVKMYTATTEKRLGFNQLHNLCQNRIQYQKFCPNCQRQVEDGEIVRGYEYEKDRYVILSPEELESFAQRSSGTIDILRFVSLAEIDPIYYNKTYYLEPSETGGKAYLLLKEALASTKKIAIAQITIRTRSTLAVVREYKKLLVLETIFYPDEIRNAEQLNVGEEAQLEEKELKMAQSLITSLTEPFQPEHYKDENRLAMLELIEKKIQGQDVVQTFPQQDQAPAVDLLTALEASLKAQAKELGDYPGEGPH